MRVATTVTSGVTSTLGLPSIAGRVTVVSTPFRVVVPVSLTVVVVTVPLLSRCLVVSVFTVSADCATVLEAVDLVLLPAHPDSVRMARKTSNNNGLVFIFGRWVRVNESGCKGGKCATNCNGVSCCGG